MLEQSDKPGGGSRTDETVPGYRFDTHSVAHNIINMTGIPKELDLAGAGLEYREMDPFLTDSLVRRLEASGGSVRCDAPVVRLETREGRVRAVVLEGGERLEAERIVTAIEPRAALLELLDPPLDGAARRDLRSAHSANSVQALLHVATDRLPPYTDARPGDWNGLQSYVDSLDDLQRSFTAADDRRLGPDPLAAYAFTTSAIDDTLAPGGHHTVYLACPAAPFRIDGGWEAAAEGFKESLLSQVEQRAPGFRASIVGTAVQTPEHMERQLRWPGAHPLHLDVTPDQLSVLRPTAALASHRVPGVRGLYVSGAGTAPVGGIAAAPGRAAARVLLQDL